MICINTLRCQDITLKVLNISWRREMGEGALGLASLFLRLAPRPPPGTISGNVPVEHHVTESWTNTTFSGL